MNVLKHKRSNLIINIMIAIVIALTVNFSYLLSMIVAERETTDQRQRTEQDMAPRPEAQGILHLYHDGYGYLKVDKNSLDESNKATVDSIYVANRKVRWYNLQDQDTILCTFFPPRHNSLANPTLDEVRQQNGNEIAAPVIYDRPKRDQDTLGQMIYYFLLTWLLLTVMTFRIEKRGKYLYRCAIVIAITVACYFLAPTVNWMTGKAMMIFQHQSRDMINWMAILKCTVALVVAILYGRIYQLLYLQQKVILENEHLRTENIQSRYNMLVGQINPHFFFNSLNSLSMLVRDNKEDKALEYIDQLSYTFRYILQNGQNTKSTLKDEMEFANAYGELFKVRYADKLFFDIDIDEKYNDWTLPALTLQPLIGNAVKHNTITRKQPFHISIRTEGSTLIVSNRKAPKLEPEPSTGIGLKNLSSRWQLITGSDIEIIDNAEEFIVRLPLQKPEN